MAKPKLGKQIQQLFSPELLAKAQQEAKLQGTSLEDLIRSALEKFLKTLSIAREEKEAESAEYARLLLYAHFSEDRNEFLTGDAIRTIGGKKPPNIGNNKSH